MTTQRLLAALFAFAVAAASAAFAQQADTPKAPATDLDALMARALAHRDQNWKKLDQYVLDEREDVEARAPGDTLMFGDHRDYTWFVRNGFFVRSPVRVNGVAISENDRLTYEQRWLERERRRQRSKDRQSGRGSSGTAQPDPTDPATPPSGDPGNVDNAGNVGSFLQQTREPGFISAGYFLEFKFEPGNYYLAGREALNGRQVLRVEYYPTRLFDEPRDQRQQRQQRDQRGRNDRQITIGPQDDIERKLNKTALVTLWVEPTSAEIVKYTFDNLGLDFLPGAWLLRITDMRAVIDMIEPFPGVWLPSTVDMRIALTLANGSYHMQYGLHYHNYKQASVKATLLPVPRQ